MAFPNDLWIASSFNGNIYNYVEEAIAGNPVSLGNTNKPQGVYVAQDQKTVFIANRENSSVSVLELGEYIDDIEVGDEPYGICEGTYQDLYVACYGSNAVYKIQQDYTKKYRVESVINVDGGPAGICSDSDGTIWVACANSGTVCKIVNNTVVMRIDTGDSDVAHPTGICCDMNDNIWVANYGSNTVIKINHSHRIITVPVDGAPIDILSDSGNNIYVASYLGDKITFIPRNDTNHPEEIALPYGAGVTAIGLDSKDNIYAIGSLDDTIYKIHKKEIVKEIKVPDSTPVGFGDFTGCRGYNVISTGRNSGEGTNANTPAEASIKLMNTLKLKFKVKDIRETADETTLTVYSDAVDLTQFDHVKLNGVDAVSTANGNATFTIPNDPKISKLDLIGYFDSAEALPAQFMPIDYAGVFKIIVGSMKDDGYGNFTFTQASDPYRTVNIDDPINTIVVDTVADGNITVLIPTRVVQQVSRGIVVNGMQIFDDWSIQAKDKPAVDSALSSFPNYTAYMNIYPSFVGTSVIVVRYKL